MSNNEYFRNDPTGTFDAHLFTDVAVKSADGGAGEQSERPVNSVCSRTTAYGPFFEVGDDAIADDLPDHEGGLCEVCKKSVREDGDEADEADEGDEADDEGGES